MMLIKKRKSFSSEQKATVALEAIRGTRGSKTLYEVALDYGIHQAQVSLWKNELIASAATLFETKRGPKSADANSDLKAIFAKIDALHRAVLGPKKSLE